MQRTPSNSAPIPVTRLAFITAPSFDGLPGHPAAGPGTVRLTACHEWPGGARKSGAPRTRENDLAPELLFQSPCGKGKRSKLATSSGAAHRLVLQPIGSMKPPTVRDDVNARRDHPPWRCPHTARLGGSRPAVATRLRATCSQRPSCRRSQSPTVLVGKGSSITSGRAVRARWLLVEASCSAILDARISRSDPSGERIPSTAV